MPNSPWWTTVSTADLLALRRRLVADVRVEFGDALGTEVEDVVQHALRGAVPAPPPEGAAEEHEEIWEVFCALGELDRLTLWNYVGEDQSIRAIARELA